MNVYADYGHVPSATPQTRPIPGRESEMVKNDAGGYGFVLDDWKRLERFLILGSEGGTYYVNQKDLTAQNAGVVIRCLKADGVRTVLAASEVNLKNRAPKVDQQLFVLALAMKHGDAATKAVVAKAAPHMVRIGTHLLHFVAMLDSMGGWNRSKRRLVSEWFAIRDPETLAFQVTKYQNRDGWHMRDVLRLAHPKAPTDGHMAIYDWLCGRGYGSTAPARLLAYRNAHDGEGTPVERALHGIAAGLPREALPTEALADSEVWRALLGDMPLHALLRNLGDVTERKVLANGSTWGNAIVTAKLLDVAALRKARVHPFAILLALLVYQSGAGVRGSKSWTPVSSVVAALEDAYDLAMGTLTPTGKRILIGIDISGSMDMSCIGTPIPASTAAAAVALTLARLEPNAVAVWFDTTVRAVVPVTKRSNIASFTPHFQGGGTDVAAPIVHATQRKEVHDAFVVLTDNETWAGMSHPAQALAAYRKAVNPNAKLICCSMASNNANVVDPKDPLSFGCAGLDANIASLVADFIGAAA